MRKIIVAFLPFLLAGCAVGPKYVRPAVQPPANFYTEQQTGATSAADMAWWDLFKDPVLQSLIREALKNNYDLQLAMARVEQERALVGVSRSQYYPQVGYGASISGQQSPTTPDHTYYSYSFSTIWEIDLFGRIRKLNEAQRAAYFSSEKARRDVRLVALSDVAQGYLQLRALDEQFPIARRAPAAGSTPVLRLTEPQSAHPCGLLQWKNTPHAVPRLIFGCVRRDQSPKGC